MYSAKPQAWHTLQSLIEDTRRAAPNALLVAHHTPTDVAASTDKYVHAYHCLLNFDAVIINPFTGLDTIEPWLNDDDKGVFVHCLHHSINSPSRYRLANGTSLYRHIAQASGHQIHNQSGRFRQLPIRRRAFRNIRGYSRFRPHVHSSQHCFGRYDPPHRQPTPAAFLSSIYHNHRAEPLA